MSRGGCQCSVAICKNRSTKNKNLETPLSYYCFPRDPVVRDLWIKSCRRDGHWNPSTSRICSEHFSPEQFEDDMEARLMGLKRTRKLKPGAVPTLKLSLTEATSESEHRKSKRRKNSTVDHKSNRGKRIRNEISDEDNTEVYPDEPDIEIIEVKYNSPDTTDSCNKDSDAAQSSSSDDIPHSLDCPFVEENKCLKSEVASLKSKLKDTLKKLDSSKKKNAALEIALMRCLTLKATPP